MKTYLVGGAVRDELLGLPGGDRDHVVVGATPEMMRARGFRQVGRDFPVFLHPHTGEEYALARTERKSGRGHQGFVVHASPDVTLEQDLARRDFTINAIARDLDSGALIDPHGGVADIQHRVLRHVGAAFVEDPLRVLRAARFMARFAPLGFSIAPETVTLMRQVAAAGELESLSAERIWQELVRALRSARPSAFLASLRECGALARVLPEVDALYGVPQRADYHPEVDTGVHVEMVCDMAARLAPGDDLIGFAALTHDLGKALTPAAELPRHPLHESRGLKPLQALAERLRVPNEHRQLAAIVCREHLNVHRLMELKPATVLKILERADAFRKPMRIDQLASACEADSRGRAGHADTPYPQANELRRLFAAARVPRAAELADRHSGPALGEALRRARIRAIAEARDAASTSQAQADDADQTALHAEQASCRTHPIRRAAMQGYVDDIEKATEDNQDYRRVVYTGKHMQLVLMCLQPGEEIGEEVHEGHDQFFRFEEGSGEVQIDGQSHAVKGDFGVIVPAGARHNVINTGAKPMRLYTLYGPPEHRHDVVHASKADEQEEHFDGTTSE